MKRLPQAKNGNKNMQPLVAPFIGERYQSLNDMTDLIAPPYDVITPEQRAKLAGSNQANVVNVTLPEGEDPYAVAAQTLESWRETGVLKKDSRAAVYVLRQTYQVDGKTHARTGVISGVSVESYETGRVRPHEKTHAHVKEDRLALLRRTRTMCESLFFLAPDRSGALKALLAEAVAVSADVEAELDGVKIELWKVEGSAGVQIAKSAGQTHIYIADGHHRFETGWAFRDEEPAATRTLALIVPLGDPGLIVLPTHRLLDGSSITKEDVVEVVGSRFLVRDLPESENMPDAMAGADRTCCVVALQSGEKIICELKEDADLADFANDRDEAVANLDIARIDALVVGPLRERSSAALSYSASLKEVESRLSSGTSAAVIVEPTGVEDVVRVADAGAVMPQKATYFIPKVPSGMVFLNLADQTEE
jgi:uncharacterized protein (DUF1015 family)